MKIKEIRSISKEDRGNKLKDSRMELIKSQVSSAKTGGSRAKNIRKIIARILTVENRTEKEQGEQGKIKLLKRKISKAKS